VLAPGRTLGSRGTRPREDALNEVFASARVVLPPKPALDVVTGDLPKTSTANVFVLAVTLAPGDATFWHTHPTPTFMYVVNGTGDVGI